MSVTVASVAAAYREWHPGEKQYREPDTTYLLDPAGESARVTLAQGRMLGGNESFGTSGDLPPWLGGTKTEIVAGKYRDGLRSAGTYVLDYVALPCSGLFGDGQGTIEGFVKSSVAWADLASNEIPFKLNCDSRQYIQVRIGAGAIRADFRHEQDPAGEIELQAFANHAADADEWVSVAVTLLEETLTLYVDEEPVADVGGCIPPRFWNDNWTQGTGLAFVLGSEHLTVSDLRVSRLARVPGETPTP